MKQFTSTGMLVCAALVIILSSCGGSGNEKTTTTDSTATDTTSAPVLQTSTIVTTPQYMVIVTHKVSNYAKWKAAYEGHDSARRANGIRNYVIGRGLKDSNMVLVALRADDTAKAKLFVKDPGLKKAMQKGGVVGMPNLSMIEATWQDTGTIDSKLRLRATFAVKDWDTWLKRFQDSKQIRMDNGVAERVISHELNDKNKVGVVMAITDSAKAAAFYKSDELKKRRAASGVIGEPVHFAFRIVQRY